jgi:cbb3-type cytochrome oxidase maturation protein
MESLYLLIPLSVLLVLGVGALLAWSVMSGQFDDMEDEGRRILHDEAAGPRSVAQDKATTPPPARVVD